MVPNGSLAGAVKMRGIILCGNPAGTFEKRPASEPE